MSRGSETLGTIFDWETTSYWARTVGALFIALAWLEWNIAARLEERGDLVWPFALVPADTTESTDTPEYDVPRFPTTKPPTNDKY